jgi:hypothetical protein
MGFSLASSWIRYLCVCAPSSMCCLHARVNWLISWGDPPLRLSQRTARAPTRFASRMQKTPPPEPKQKPPSAEQRSRSHQTKEDALALSTHTYRVAEPNSGRAQKTAGRSVSDMPRPLLCLGLCGVVWRLEQRCVSLAR